MFSDLCADFELPSDDDVDKIMRPLTDLWLASLHSEGSNNSATLAGIKKVFSAMHRVCPFDGRSSLVDLGSGAGLPAIYAALKYGIPAYGIEYDPKLVEIAKGFALKAGVQDLVSFEVRDIGSLDAGWYQRRGITHVYSYDVVFEPGCWNQMFDVLKVLPLFGASSRRFVRNWPKSIEPLETVPRVMLAGNKSGFAFGLWQNSPKHERRRESSPRRSRNKV